MFNYSFFKTRIHIALNLLFGLSFSKIKNLIINLFAYYFKKTKAGKCPSILTLQLSYRCNYSCIMCQKSSLDKNVYSGNFVEMDFQKLERELRKSAKYISVLKITGGEPLIYPDFERLIDLLNELNLKYTLLTNGSLFNDEIARKIIKNCIEISVSIDSADEEIYAFMRKGGELHIVENNLKMIHKFKTDAGKKTPYFNIAVACFSFNIDGLDKLVEFSHRNNIPTMSIAEGGYYNTPEIKDEHFIKEHKELCFVAVNKAQKRADELNITIRWNSPILYFAKEENQVISNRNRVSSCVNFFYSGLLTPDFKFKVCPLSNPIADLSTRTLQEYWNCDEMKRLRETILQNNFPVSCKYCNDYNEHFDNETEYSYVDYQKKTKYWKL